MALDRHIARLAKILVDSENITFDEAQAKLRKLTLEVVVSTDATSPAAHAAVLTAVAIGRRTFVGGVSVTGAIDQPLNAAFPLKAENLREAVYSLGASTLDAPPSRIIVIGVAETPSGVWAISTWWNGWRAGTAQTGKAVLGDDDNPLAGIAAAALAVSAAFEAERGHCVDLWCEANLWPVGPGEEAPPFTEVYLPGALWLIGLGNLGQAFLWALAALPYSNPADVSLVLQDRDKVDEENWATSVLVKDEFYGELKTKVAEQWALAKGFDVRRIDRRFHGCDQFEDGDPRIALSGVDKIEARKSMARIGFHCIVDAGLGRTSSDFDRYRVTVFDNVRPIDKHFAEENDKAVDEAIQGYAPYQRLEAEIGTCGMAKVAGASVAAPYVSALAATVAISRLIAIASGCECPTNEVRRLSLAAPSKIAKLAKFEARGFLRAGRPTIIK